MEEEEDEQKAEIIKRQKHHTDTLPLSLTIPPVPTDHSRRPSAVSPAMDTPTAIPTMFTAGKRENMHCTYQAMATPSLWHT